MGRPRTCLGTISVSLPVPERLSASPAGLLGQETQTDASRSAGHLGAFSSREGGGSWWWWGRLVAPGARRRALGVMPRVCCDATSSCPPHKRLVTRLALHWTSQLQGLGIAGKMEEPAPRPGRGFPTRTDRVSIATGSGGLSLGFLGLFLLLRRRSLCAAPSVVDRRLTWVLLA